MAKKVKVLAAGILRDIRFDCADRADEYLYKLDHLKVVYKVLDSCRCSDGTVILRMLEAYNDHDLIEIVF